MSSPQITESSKGLLVTIRIISLELPRLQYKNIPHIETRFGNSIWISSKTTEYSSKIHWSQNHTFDLPEILPLQFKVFHKTVFFKEVEIGNCVIKAETFSGKKGTRISELLNKEGAKITIVWGFVIDEERKNECEDYVKLINEVEVEREEIKYYKNSYQK